jgi:hypothetical protein
MSNGCPIRFLKFGESRPKIMTTRCDTTVRFLAAVFACLLVSLSSAQVKGSKPAPSPAGKRNTQFRSTFPLTKFYDTPEPLPRGNPGELIRAEEFTGYDLPPGVVAVRILYRSRSAQEQEVAASGVVLYPEAKPPLGGWPVIAWAHDLSGVARQCAPSLARNLERGPFLSMYASLGYAVVATDYTGLGTKFRHAFRDIGSNARDVIYAIPAAHKAVPELGSEWIAMGYGDGGLTVIGMAESGLSVDHHYLGGIVLAGLAGLETVDRTAGGSPYNAPLSVVYGVKTVFPEFEVKDVLTPSGLALYQKLDEDCAEPVSQEKSAGELLKPNWQNNRYAEQYFSRNTIGEKPAQGPFLVIASEANSRSGSGTEQVIRRMCQQGDRVQFEKYSNPDPGNVVGESVRDQMAWIQGRFAGRPAPGNCPGQP